MRGMDRIAVVAVALCVMGVLANIICLALGAAEGHFLWLNLLSGAFCSLCAWVCWEMGW